MRFSAHFPQTRSFRTCRGRLAGFSVVEVLTAVVILAFVFVSLYQGFSSILRIIAAARERTDAMLLANEQVEVIRNLPYAAVGLIAGIPAGSIPRTKSVVRNGVTYDLTISVRNVDDPFDGTIGGSPNDLAPADYKQVEVDIACATCRNFLPQTIVTTVAPRNLENTTGNGALFVNVFDASGNPVSEATVRIINSTATTTIDITDVTNATGVYQLIDVPPANLAYEVTVTKNGYSSSRTYPPGAIDNPNPVLSHATVLGGQATTISFSIDRVAELGIHHLNQSCQGAGTASFLLTGSKTIGSEPTVYKFKDNFTTNSAGELALSDLEWDTYALTLTTSGRVLSGSLPFLPLVLSPGASQDLTIVTAPARPKEILFSIRAAGSGLPVASSTIVLSQGGFAETQVTDRGFFIQTDWSGGAGQTLFTDDDRFASADGGIDYATEGVVTLQESLGQYFSAGTLTSSIFDTGGTDSTYYTLAWLPGSQATSTGADSVRLQLASSNDPATTSWQYLGPDGTEESFYTIPGQTVSFIHQGDRYVRYRLALATADPLVSPLVADVSLTYGTSCLPFGQALFNDLGTGDYQVEVSREDYQTYNGTINVLDDWQSAIIDLSPL